MQLFTNKSEEGNLPGLGWIDAEAVKFKFDGNQSLRNKIPHMGWNTVEITQKNGLFDDMYPEPRFYFLHSYHVCCNNTENILTKTVHGFSFVSSIVKDNITGIQFHPEKSHKFGMKLLSNFVSLA
jgi:glutamine amidotransferase